MLIQEEKKLVNLKMVLEDVSSIKGHDLLLSIDADVQRVAAEEEFIGKRGAVVAIEPNTGEILALVSAPEYDLNQFSYVTSREYLKQLYDDPDKPLFNRATMSLKPPGSTFKMLGGYCCSRYGSYNYPEYVLLRRRIYFRQIF